MKITLLHLVQHPRFKKPLNFKKWLLFSSWGEGDYFLCFPGGATCKLWAQ